MEKNPKQTEVKNKIATVLKNELGWSVNASKLNPATDSFANHVFFFSFNNETFYAKYFPTVFKDNESVDKPEGSFLREFTIYEFLNKRNYKVAPEFIFRARNEPILITKSWGSGNFLSKLNSLTQEEILKQITCVISKAVLFRSYLMDSQVRLTLGSQLNVFSRLQEQYLIHKPLQRLGLSPQDATLFEDNYSILQKDLAIGDLSLKNILVKDSDVRFCDFESIFLAPLVFDISYLTADLLSKVSLQNEEDLLKKIDFLCEEKLNPQERALFFPLVSICMSYRTSNTVNSSSKKEWSQDLLQTIFHTRML